MDLLTVGQKICIYFQKNESLIEIACNISRIEKDRLAITLPKHFMRYIEYLEQEKTVPVRVLTERAYQIAHNIFEDIQGYLWWMIPVDIVVGIVVYCVQTIPTKNNKNLILND